MQPWQAQPPRSTPGDARPDSDFDVLVVMPQATLTPPPERLAGSRWHVVARALREGRELHVAG